MQLGELFTPLPETFAAPYLETGHNWKTMSSTSQIIKYQSKPQKLRLVSHIWCHRRKRISTHGSTSLDEKRSTAFWFNRCFPSPHDDESIGHKVFNARFGDKIRHVGTPHGKHKSLLILQDYKDKAHGLLTYAATVQRSSQRIILHIASHGLENLVIFINDII